MIIIMTILKYTVKMYEMMRWDDITTIMLAAVEARRKGEKKGEDTNSAVSKRRSELQSVSKRH
jgi:hypothetical protein